MAINFHPEQGTILICDFPGFVEPEIVKRRPVIVLSPRLRSRGNLCTIVPCSTTPPKPVQPYHHRIRIDPPLPAPYDSEVQWIKTDMIYTVGFNRLFLPFLGKVAADGKRQYDVRTVSDDDLELIQQGALKALGLNA